MINDWFRFPSSMNLNDDERRANEERLEKARKNIVVKSPQARCFHCLEREILCECAVFDNIPF